MKKKVYAMTNDFGKKFLNDWFKKYDIIGVEEDTDNLRKEFFIIYKYPQNTTNGFGIAVAVLPQKDSINDGCCFFGDLDYFARIHACNKVGLKILWMPNGTPMWPVWYADKENFLKFKKVYDELKGKYENV